ncbi:DUF6440 family protein [Ruminococcus flavefaciens]|uniref:DUF6440 domain-containing protein n=1 Tax=Ruminococcus flavefaciens 007c TaxID=1341157 RepID=W7UV90_RUMFL|nr:DUF6440 family protein [Ruminococcus flavefaciens]EWM52735.1 hypothetical protein RF007C_13960 [Ruminococcus flavefaciens 007c]
MFGNQNKPQLPQRFEMLSEQRISNSTYVTLVDTVTGVTYVSVTHTLDSSTIMQPLLDRDGKPYIDPRYGGR